MSESYRPHQPAPEARPPKESSTSTLHITLGKDRTRWNSLANTIGDRIERAISAADYTFEQRRAFAERIIGGLKKNGSLDLEDIPADIAARLAASIDAVAPQTVSRERGAIVADEKNNRYRNEAAAPKTTKQMVDAADMRDGKTAPTFSTDVEFPKLGIDPNGEEKGQFFENVNPAKEAEDAEEDNDEDDEQTNLSPERQHSKERREKQITLLFYGLNDRGRKKIAAIEEEHEKWKKGIETRRKDYRGNKAEEFSKEFLQPLETALSYLERKPYAPENWRLKKLEESEKIKQLFNQILEREKNRTEQRNLPPLRNEFSGGRQRYFLREKMIDAQKALTDIGFETETFVESKRIATKEGGLKENRTTGKKNEGGESLFSKTENEEQFAKHGRSGKTIDGQTNDKKEGGRSNPSRARGGNSKNKRRDDLRDTIRGTNGTV